MVADRDYVPMSVSNVATSRNGWSLVTDLILWLGGLDRTLADRRPAWLSVAACRVCLFGSILFISQRTWNVFGGDAGFAAWYASRISAPYYPFGPLLLFGHDIPGLAFWYGCEAVALYAGICAIIGMCTRPAMILSTISSLFLIVLQASSSWFWSHSYNVVFLCAIPFSFCNAGSSLSVDRVIGRFLPWYPFGRRTEPVFWGVLAGQAAAALFYFGAFYAKIFETWHQAGILGPYYYVFSDNMRNILGMSWLGIPEYPIPPWIHIAWSYPIIWEALILGHLFMQAIPIFAIVSADHPRLRLFEGANFFVGIVALGIFMAGWNWWWMPLAAFFVDWDYWAAAVARLLPDRFRLLPRSVPVRASAARMSVYGALLFFFFGTYLTGVLSQHANNWKTYPFSNFSFYAGLYLRPPYDRHMPYADYLIGHRSLMVPENIDPRSVAFEGWEDFDGRHWSGLNPEEAPKAVRYRERFIEFPSLNNNFHGLGREEDLDKLKAGMWDDLALLHLGHSRLPPGTKVVVFRNTAGIPAYPEAVHKKVLHRGVRAILDIDTGEFVGLTVELDRNTGVLTIKDLRGEIGDYRQRRVFTRVGAIDHSEVQPLIEVPGTWISPEEFRIDRDFILKGPGRGKLVNSIIRTNTIFGSVDFDGFVQWW
jgi:hypothetical protein